MSIRSLLLTVSLAACVTVAAGNVELVPSDDFTPVDDTPIDEVTPEPTPMPTAVPTSVPTTEAPATPMPTPMPTDVPTPMPTGEPAQTSSPSTLAPTPVPNPVYCNSNNVCNKHGDTGAKCLNGMCVCSTGFEILKLNGEMRESDGCWAAGTDPTKVKVQRFCKIHFKGGVFSKLDNNGKGFFLAFLRKMFSLVFTSQYVEGSIIAGSVTEASLAQADNATAANMKTEWTNNLASDATMEATFGSPDLMDVTVSNEGDNCPGKEGVAEQLMLGQQCVPFTCLSGYTLNTGSSPTCVKDSSSNSLSAGVIVAIVLGAVVFIVLVTVAIFYLFCRKVTHTNVIREEGANV
eukprot:TRINITY_DN10255_c0_g3_i1.p1 TRINITY_DN10255_c0_g3~~TRINITY_DN10255_c0_g3_i1.p1  ORF type:complete len:348 (+),score=102.96 TRINITY_DN10255_c0_g3_i1:60-1103(+)